MNRILPGILCSAFLLFGGALGLCAPFDERLWEKYAPIDPPTSAAGEGLAGVYLEPWQMGDQSGKAPFSDLRVVTDRREEVPWRIISRRPETRQVELPHQILNHSQTDTGETWLEILVASVGARPSAVEIITPDSDFSRQVQVLGSTDGSSWNTLRRDGVAFDSSRGDRMRLTRITFPRTNYPRLALRLTNSGAPPLTISGVKVLQESEVPEQTYAIQATMETPQTHPGRREQSIVVRMNSVFPLDRLVLETAERNFQRLVEVQIKRETGDWERWAQGTIFRFDAPEVHESQLKIDIPEVATREFRLVFKNLDSPPLPIMRVTGEGYRRLLVFKQPADRKLYLFWGNPQAQPPQYDLAGLIAKQDPDLLPLAQLGQSRPNTAFAGNSARLPFTERYKSLLYGVVTLAIAGLMVLQYRVFRQADQ